MKPKHVLASIGIAVVLAVWAGIGCGDSDRDVQVAKVGTVPISRSELLNWTRSFKAGGQGDLAARRAMEFLVRSEWIRQAASARGIRLNAMERAALEKELNEGPGLSGEELVRALGMDRKTFQARARIDALRKKLQRHVFGPSRPDAGQLHDYFSRHRDQFFSPETVDLRTIVVSRRATGFEARRALAGGAQWNEVAQRFAAPHSPRRVSVDRTNIFDQLREEALSAPRGSLRGPLRVEDRWWLFEVERIHPGHRLSYAEARPAAVRLLTSIRELAGLERLVPFLRARYREKTFCVRRYAIPECDVVVSSIAG
jgi:hypothetical protein